MKDTVLPWLGTAGSLQYGEKVLEWAVISYATQQGTPVL